MALWSPRSNPIFNDALMGVQNMARGRRSVLWENWGQSTARIRQLQEVGENILARHST